MSLCTSAVSSTTVCDSSVFANEVWDWDASGYRSMSSASMCGLSQFRQLLLRVHPPVLSSSTDHPGVQVDQPLSDLPSSGVCDDRGTRETSRGQSAAAADQMELQTDLHAQSRRGARTPRLRGAREDACKLGVLDLCTETMQCGIIDSPSLEGDRSVLQGTLLAHALA